MLVTCNSTMIMYVYPVCNKIAFFVVTEVTEPPVRVSALLLRYRRYHLNRSGGISGKM